MTERTEYQHGVPSWIDLQTTDQDAAKQFYSELFGWSYQDDPVPQGGVYSMAQRNGRDVAAISTQQPGQREAGIPPAWNSYVTVDDIDASTGKVAGAGGSVMMEPFDIMDAGRMSVVGDPTGAVIALWQKKNHIGAGLVNEHGTLTWNELISPEVTRAAEFYSEIFGWTTDTMDMGDMGDYTVFNLNGEAIAGAMAPPMEGMPPHWGVYFNVDDCDAAVGKASELGASVMAEPVDSPVGRMAHLVDPQGAHFAVIQPPAGQG